MIDPKLKDDQYDLDKKAILSNSEYWLKFQLEAINLKSKLFQEEAEEDYCEPDEWHCDLCNKKFKIKYENDRPSKTK